MATFAAPSKKVAPARPRFLSAAEQTRGSWAMRLREPGEVPPAFREFYAGLSLAPGELPYSVLTPSFEGFLHRQEPKLLCLLGSEINVVERRGRGFRVTRFAAADVNYVQVGNALLRSWLQLSGVAGGKLASCSFQYSAVSQHLLDPFVEKVRAVPRTSEADLAAEREKFSYLSGEHYKFMNFARRSILPGERVLASLVQPAIRRPLLKRLIRLVSPAHIAILTDRELILVAEPRERFVVRGAPYGGIWNHVPLHRIAAVSLTPRDDRLVLWIELPGGDRLKAVFASANEEKVRAFVRELEAARRSRDS
jgi:hypothetical protein